MSGKEKYLPIGTVVKLKNAKKSIMITGFCVSPKGDNVTYDYCACLYPEGVVSSNSNLLFNHEQIAEIYFLGYTNEEEKEFKNKLSQLINFDLTDKEVNKDDSFISNNDLWN